MLRRYHSAAVATAVRRTNAPIGTISPESSAALMKYAGLSRSSVKRAMKDLLASKLLVLVDQGGVTPDGQNECNVYQLMVPTDPKVRAGATTGGGVAGVPTPGSAVNPPGVRTRTPSRFSAEPPAGPTADPDPVPGRTDRGGRLGAAGGSGNEPLFRSVDKEHLEDSKQNLRRLSATMNG